jgi:putative ABC transport system ATP-binding protein
MFRNLARKEQPVEAALAAGGALIELRQVVKKYHNAAGEFIVLKGGDVAFQPGEFTSIVGRSGSGKSTLLNMITGIDHPSSGYVRVGDVILHTMNEGRLSVWRGQMMGIVFQFFQLLPMLTLLENTMLPMDFCAAFPQAERESRAKKLLALVGLEGLEHKYPAAVSGGQQQSAAVARALANDPPLLIADEPTGNLDSKTAERVLEIFEEQAQAGKTILMVTHDATLARRARRILIISDGELIPEGLSNAFPGLGHDLLHQVSHAGQPRRYQPGAIILRGEEAPALLLVKSGDIAAVVNAEWGTQVVAEHLLPGSYFSREDGQAVRSSLAGLKAETEVDVLVIETLPDPLRLQGSLAAAARERAEQYAQAACQRGERGLLNDR